MAQILQHFAHAALITKAHDDEPPLSVRPRQRRRSPASPAPGCATSTHPAPLRSTSVAPALALLLGLPFPAEMRAGDDELDLLADLVDPAAFPPGYLDLRRTSLTRFRAANAAQLRAWRPASAGSWDRFYALHRARQRRAALPALLATLLPLAWQARAQ